MATWLAYLKSKLLLPETDEEEFKALGIEAKDNAVYRANMMEIEKTKLDFEKYFCLFSGLDAKQEINCMWPNILVYKKIL